MSAWLRMFVSAAGLCLLMPACASLQARDPLQVTVAGIEPLEGQGLEMRMNVKLRVQNPNDSPVEYSGVAVEMEVQGKTFATGVADIQGVVPRFGESVLEVPVTISAFRMARQAVGMMRGGGLGKIDYLMKGKLSSGMSATRFTNQGSFDFSAAPPPATN